MTLPQIHTARRRARHTARGLRRVVVGAWSLSPVRTLRWVAERRHPAGGAPENTSLTWVATGEDRTTRVWVHNYWSDAYGIPEPELRARLLDAAGAPVAEWTMVLAPDATEVVDVRERLLAEGRPAAFEGQLLLSVSHEKLFAGRPVQVLGEYVRLSDGATTGVHGQYGLMDSPVAQVVGGMRVEASPGARTSVVITNAYAGPGGPSPFRPELEVRNEAGERRRVRLGMVEPLATNRVYLDEAISDLRGFLGGRAGHASVTLPVPSSRVATLTEFGDRWLANHGTVDRIFDQGLGLGPEWTASRPVASVLVRCGPGFDTTITLPNRWGPLAADYRAAIEVFDGGGRPVAAHDVVVPRGGMRTVALGELLGSRVEQPFTGHAEVRLAPVEALDEVPAVIDLLVGVVRDGELVGEVQVGGEFFNAPVPPTSAMPDIRRTRTFGRVDLGRGQKSFVYLANPAAAEGYDVVARPTLTLLALDGTVVATSEVEIPPHGCVLIDVAEHFGVDGSRLEGGAGVLRVRDTAARLFGYYFSEADATASVPICHLLGG